MAIDFTDLLIEDPNRCESIAPWQDGNPEVGWRDVRCNLEINHGGYRHAGNGWTWLDPNAEEKRERLDYGGRVGSTVPHIPGPIFTHEGEQVGYVTANGDVRHYIDVEWKRRHAQD